MTWLKGNKNRLGKKHTEKAKIKIREARARQVLTLERNDKISRTMKGRKPYIATNETKEKMSRSHKGTKLTEKTRKRISEAITGKKHPNWQGGISFEPYSIDWTETLKRAIRERDHYLCQVCSQYGNAVHHIDYDKKNCNPNNLITTCVSCNTKANFNREYWTNYFSIKLTN